MGMSRQLFVWSLAPGPHAGDPCEHISGQREAARIPRERSDPEERPLEATGSLTDVLDELSHGRLRCGWGVAHPAVDGRLDAPSGGEPERMAGQHDGASDPEPLHAVGRRPVGCRLREMAAGDVVFLPKSPDDGHFMVATVQRPYACDRATVMDEADVRHECRQVIGVEETMRYAYGVGTLYPDLLEAPRRQAIQRIAEDDPSYHTLAEFLRSWGR
jgi:hypothetical protein